jgi:endonuclease/exonuclease/phosphatase (EEP) superfamily protein YafD
MLRAPFFSAFRTAFRAYAARYAHRRAALVATVALVSWTGGWHWIAELFSHAFFQYALLLLALTALVFYARPTRVGRVAALVATALVWLPLLPYVLPVTADAAREAPETRLTLLQINTQRKTEALSEWLSTHAKDVDVVLALEVDTPFARVIETFSTEFPYHIESYSDDSFGIALISRHPFAEAQILDAIDPFFPAVDVTLLTPSGPLRLVGIHPPPPISAESAALRDAFLEKLAKNLNPDRPTVVFGDFNTTPWSPKFREFQSETGLEDAQRGHGLLSTWPAVLARYADVLGVPIDLTLVSASLTVASREAGPYHDSDHHPVVTRIGFGERKTKD